MTSSNTMVKYFKNQPNSIQWTNAYILCLASKLSYYGKAKNENILKSWGFTKASFLTKKDKKHLIDSQLSVSSNDEIVLVTFRGTEPKNIKDWITDLKFRQKKRAVFGGKIHRGFAAGLDLVWSELSEQLKLHEAVNKTIWLTGHSLGAALATLASQRLNLSNNYNIGALYTYGSPRVGDPEFVKNFKVPVYRFENNNDIVPKIIPKTLLDKYEYRHVGESLYFNWKGKLLKGPNKKKKRLDMLFGGLRAMTEPGIDGIEDHNLKYYAKLIKKQINNQTVKNKLRIPFPDFWS